MSTNTATTDTDTQTPCPVNSAIIAAQVTVAVLTQTFGKPVPEILADLRHLAAAAE